MYKHFICNLRTYFPVGMLAMQISVVLTRVVNIVYASHDHIVKYIVKGWSGRDTKAKKSCFCELLNEASNLHKFFVFQSNYLRCFWK